MSGTIAPRPTQLYDAIVVGTELPGLVAGALLAKRGLRVLQIDNGGPHDHHVAGGYLLPSGPTLLPQLKAQPSLHALFDELGSVPSVGRALVPYPGGLQFLLPRARLELRADPTSRRAELFRAFGDTGDAMVRAVELALGLGVRAASLHLERPPIPPTGPLARWSAARLATRKARAIGPLPLQADTPLGAAILGLHRFLSHAAGDIAAMDFAYATLPTLAEPSRLPADGLVSILRAAIASHRGDVLGEPSAPVVVEEIVLERSGLGAARFAGVRLAGQSEPHRGRICLASHDLRVLAPLLHAPRVRRGFERFAAAAPIARRLHVQNLVLAAEGIPPGMADLAFLHGGDREPALLQIEPTRRQDGSLGEGLRTATVSCLVDEGADPTRVEARIEAMLEDALPFHQRHQKLRLRAPGGGLHYDPGEEGAAFAGSPLLSPVPRLLVTNHSVLPRLGLEGALLTGQRAARLAAEKIGKVRPS